eukprot:CAMPEP_0194497864 /NCGR_PEP_ID=MMETSP0253-20130528/14674_1 /TAXON_ID=2966 /ORGANISM="Noctiluca scintillans" /LENGTH=397 /DNA_ID=CAMNT_0039339419 /DNA_START=155 /DNA_END=1348 /DNA_ORIENTATION=+
MMGSTLMTLPWGFENCGLVTGILVTAGSGLTSFYTCDLILSWGTRRGRRFEDFNDLCSFYLGARAMHLANITSIITYIGATSCYHVLMATNLQTVVQSFGSLAHLKLDIFCCGSGQAEYFVSSLLVGVAVWPLMQFRSLTVLMRVSRFGILSLLYNVLFIVGSAVAGRVDPARAVPVKLVGNTSDTGVMTGIMGLSLFVHSLVLQMSDRHTNAVTSPLLVQRDLGLAYCAAVLIYIVVGAAPAVAFELGSRVYANPEGGQLPQNILLAYSQDSVGALIGRVALTLQILIVYPILGTTCRSQFFSAVTGNDWPGYRKGTAFSTAFVMFTTLVGALYPEPGHVVGYVGAFTAVVYMVGMPVMVHLRASRLHGTLSGISVFLHVILVVACTLLMLLQFFL